MPIIRKLIDLRTSKAVILPKSWIEYYENEKGKVIEAVAIEVNESLTITPFLPKPKKKEAPSHE